MFDSIFTKENITLIIAVIGCAGSVSLWIYNFVTSRCKIDMELVRMYEPDIMIACYVAFTNRSRLPVSITSVCVVIDGVCFQCIPISYPVFTVTNSKTGEIIQQHFTLSLPINLCSLSGVSGFLAFDIPREFLKKTSTPLTFEVSTNRGRLFRKTLSYEGYADMEI